MAVSYQTDGAVSAGAQGADTGGASTGIGFGSNLRVAPTTGSPNFTNMAADLTLPAIGGGALASSAANLGNMVTDIAFVAGSGYTNGTYNIDCTATGGQTYAGAATIQVVVAGGALTSAVIVRPGSGFTSAPTFPLTALGAGSAGTLTATVGTTHGAHAKHSALASTAKKGIRVQTAGATIANGASGTGLSTYINRTGVQIVSGDMIGSVAP